MGRYYEDHPDQLSEKFKDQYEYDKGDIYFVLFIIIVIGIIFVVG